MHLSQVVHISQVSYAQLQCGNCFSLQSHLQLPQCSTGHLGCSESVSCAVAKSLASQKKSSCMMLCVVYYCCATRISYRTGVQCLLRASPFKSERTSVFPLVSFHLTCAFNPNHITAVRNSYCKSLDMPPKHSFKPIGQKQRPCAYHFSS